MTATLREQFLQATQRTVVLRVLALVLAVASSVLVARILGPMQYGIYAYVLAVTSLLALPAQMGLPALLVRETSRLHVESSWGDIRGLWKWSFLSILKLSALSGMVGACYFVLFYKDQNSSAEVAYWFGLILIPIVAMGNARGAALRGLRFIVRGQLPETVIKPAGICVLAIMAWLFADSVDAGTLMGLHVISAGIAFFIGALLLAQVTTPELRRAEPSLARRASWRRAVVPLAINSSLTVVGAQIGIIALGHYGSNAEVAYYKVAVSASMLTLFGSQAISLVVSPNIARLHVMGDLLGLQKLVGLASFGASALMLPVFIILIIFGELILKIMYGESYTQAWAPLIVLCVGNLISSFFAAAPILLTMSKNEKAAMIWLAVATAVNVSLCLFLVPRLGTLGAAFGTITGGFISSVAFWRASKGLVGVDASAAYAIKRGVQSLRQRSGRIR